MNQIFKFIAIMLFSYLIGSIPSGYILGKIFKKIDLREHGSGNVGATNTLRVLGTGFGVIALILDIGKGMLCLFLCSRFLDNPTDLSMILVGVMAILGHIFTIFLGFKGGKGVATSAGVFVYLLPIPSLITFAVFILVVYVSKYVSLGSMVSALVLWIMILFTNIRNSFDKYEYFSFVSLVVVFIFIRHRGNIIRLIKGTENKLTSKRKL